MLTLYWGSKPAKHSAFGTKPASLNLLWVDYYFCCLHLGKKENTILLCSHFFGKKTRVSQTLYFISVIININLEFWLCLMLHTKTAQLLFILWIHSHCQDFDVHNLLSELPACSGVVVKGAIVVFQIPGGIDTVILCLNRFTHNICSNIINNKLCR